MEDFKKSLHKKLDKIKLYVKWVDHYSLDYLTGLLYTAIKARHTRIWTPDERQIFTQCISAYLGLLDYLDTLRGRYQDDHHFFVESDPIERFKGNYKKKKSDLLVIKEEIDFFSSFPIEKWMKLQQYIDTCDDSSDLSQELADMYIGINKIMWKREPHMVYLFNGKPYNNKWLDISKNLCKDEYGKMMDKKHGTLIL